MDNSQRSSLPAFDQARDQVEAWRRQQIALLTTEQRDRYEALGKEHERRIDNAAARLAADEQTRIIAATRRELFDPPKPAPRPHGQTAELSPAERARLFNAVPDYVDGKKTPDTVRFAARLASAHDNALRKEHDAREVALRPVREGARQERDDFLRTCEKERSLAAMKDKARGDFAPAAAEGKAKTDFQKSAAGDGIKPEPVKSDAIARAIAKVKAKEQEERARSERERLTDTFNRSR